jgi:hypothetical protein
LHALARRYRAEFFSNPARRRRTVGDLSAYLHGLEWAATLRVASGKRREFDLKEGIFVCNLNYENRGGGRSPRELVSGDLAP